MQLGVRFYDAGIGRFTQIDPAKDGVNWYGYVSGGPLATSDPTGMANRTQFPSRVWIDDSCNKLSKSQDLSKYVYRVPESVAITKALNPSVNPSDPIDALYWFSPDTKTPHAVKVPNGCRVTISCTPCSKHWFSVNWTCGVLGKVVGGGVVPITPGSGWPKMPPSP